MQAELKAKWVEALRSGKYQQGNGQLVEIDAESDRCDAYCCLGVLADVAGLNPRRFWLDSFLGGRESNNNDCGLGPHELPGDPQYEADDETTLTNPQRKLAAMNDNGKSFGEIADWIEQNIPADAS